MPLQLALTQQPLTSGPIFRLSTSPNARREWTTQGQQPLSVHPAPAFNGAETHLPLRKALGKVLAEAKSLKLSQVSIELETQGTPADALLDSLHVMGETVGLYGYSFTHTYTDLVGGHTATHKPREVWEPSVTVTLCGSEGTAAAAAALSRGFQEAEILNKARQWGDRPSHTKTPAALALEMAQCADGLGTATILDKEALEAQGFGGVLAVGAGSPYDPRVVVLDHNPAGATRTLVIIGKGVVFDTGGYSIKPKKGHNEMKYDMCGSANTIAAWEILARRKVPYRVVAIVGLAENVIGPKALRPGDVYRSWNGKLIDVYNTDAEGRLILSDLLAYSGTFQPHFVADMATLTGGTTQIASNYAAIACLSSEDLFPALRAAGKSSGEKWIHLEIFPEAIENMAGDVSDYTNMHNRWAEGAMTMHAAAFLKEFVPANTPWYHLDIANVAYHGRDNGYMAARGANAFGARSLVDLCEIHGRL